MTEEQIRSLLGCVLAQIGQKGTGGAVFRPHGSKNFLAAKIRNGQIIEPKEFNTKEEAVRHANS